MEEEREREKKRSNNKDNTNNDWDGPRSSANDENCKICLKGEHDREGIINLEKEGIKRERKGKKKVLLGSRQSYRREIAERSSG